MSATRIPGSSAPDRLPISEESTSAWLDSRCHLLDP